MNTQIRIVAALALALTGAATARAQEPTREPSPAPTPDPRPVLRGNTTPVLVLRGGCDFLPVAVAKEYAATFPQSQMVQVENAGHAI